MNGSFWETLFFFFSSRRRHTRLQGDWSSDVCSSDLPHLARLEDGLEAALSRLRPGLLDELRGEIGPHDLEPARGELEGDAAVAAGDVQDPEGAGGPEGLHEEIRLLAGGLFRAIAHPGVEDEPGEERGPPFGLGVHVFRPTRVVPEVGVEPTRGFRRSRV